MWKVIKVNLVKSFSLTKMLLIEGFALFLVVLIEQKAGLEARFASFQTGLPFILLEKLNHCLQRMGGKA